MPVGFEVLFAFSLLFAATDPVAEDGVVPEQELLRSVSSGTRTRAGQQADGTLFKGRIGGKRKLRSGGGSKSLQAVEAGLEWLVNHQSEDGSWHAEGFIENCPDDGEAPCGGGGFDVYSVGVTGLALLALQGAGDVYGSEAYQDSIERGIAWLLGQQDPVSGLIGKRSSQQYLYSHSIATLAIVEAYFFSGDPELEGPCQDAVEAIQMAQYPKSGWAYDPHATDGGARRGRAHHALRCPTGCWSH